MYRNKGTDRLSLRGSVTEMHRAFTVVCAAVGLVLLSPLFVAIAIAIKYDDGGPVFYSQRRVGQGFRVFLLLKFRSMVVNADKAGLLTSPQDSRLTRIGLFLRKYKIFFRKTV